MTSHHLSLHVLAHFILLAKNRLIILLLTLLFSGEIFAQSNLDPEKGLSQYVLRSWDTQDGLTSESSNEMIQSDDGYIWIGTYTGLHRFDGKDFTIFNSQNSILPSPNVLCVKKDFENQIWLGTLHGIIAYKNGAFYTPPGLEKSRSMSIEEMLITRNGKLWFSTKSNQIFCYEKGEMKEFTQKFQLTESTALSLVEDNEGTVYFGTDNSWLVSFSEDEDIKRTKLDDEVNGINAMHVQNDTLYLGTGRGLYVKYGNQITKIPILRNTSITTLLSGGNKELWLGTLRGLYRWQPSASRLDSLTEQNGMPNNIVRNMTFDQDGKLWVGTYRKGIFILMDGSITSYTKNDGLATNIISSAVEIAEDTYLLGNENGVLNQLKNGRITEFKSPIPIPTERLKNLFRDNKNRIWVSTYGGLVVIDGENSRYYSVSNGFPDNSIRLAYQDKDDNVWVGTKNAGLFIFKSLDEWERITIDDGLSSNYILSIEQDSVENIVVGTISGMNIINDKKVVKSVTVDDGLPSNFMFATHTTPNYIWIASNDGLTGYNDGKVVNFNTQNGMPSNIIYDVIEDESGNLWMPSENSILSVKIADLEAAVENPEHRIKVKQYDKSYGMKDSHCIGAVLSYTDSKGHFWIPTIGGIVRLNPNEIKTPDFNPKTIIENIYADNVSVPLSERVVIPPGTDRVLIDFTGISYAQTDFLQFRYRLAPFDDDWVYALDSRDGLYTNLAPGTYDFQLQTGLDDNYFSPILNQRIIIEATWWQTVWAKVFAVILVICIAILIYWLRLRALTANNARLEATVSHRTNALEKQKQELKVAIEQLKNAQEQMIQSDKMASLGILAAGVAHEINNPLNFIQGGVEGLEQTLKRSKKIKKDEYEVLIKAIKEGISRASTIVLSLNEFSHSSDKKLEPCNIHHLIENCLTMIRYRLKNGIELTKEFDEKDAKVNGNNGKLHQAFLNIITNSIQAIDKDGSITIRTKVTQSSVFIDFIDSGHGIKPEHLKKITEPFFSTKEPGKGTGLGLSITYSIINEHGGSLNYSSKWSEGTTASIMLPLIEAK